MQWMLIVIDFFHLCWLWLSIVHNVTCLRASFLHANCKAHFTHINWYFKYVLGSLAIEVFDQYIFPRLGRMKVTNNLAIPNKHTPLFMSSYYLTNWLHYMWQDFTYHVGIWRIQVIRCATSQWWIVAWPSVPFHWSMNSSHCNNALLSVHQY